MAATDENKMAAWVPKTEGEKVLKEAMDKIFRVGPNSVLTESPDKKKPRFILQTQGYFSIYLYIVQGVKLTPTTEQFETKYNKSLFALVDKVDAGAYSLLRDSTVNIFKHCNDFNNKGLGRLTTSADGAISYAIFAIKLFKEKADLNLYEAFGVLLDPKYLTAPKDDAFEDAKSICTSNIAKLQKSAVQKAADAKDMCDLLQSFHTNTDADAQNVRLIKQNFLDGPLDAAGKRKLKPDGKEQEPYNNILSDEITRLQDEVASSTTTRDSENDKWETAKNNAIGYSAGGVFIFWFFIGAGIETKKAMDAKEKYDEMVALIIKDNQTKADLVAVLELVRALVGALRDLLPKMEEALNAMTELQNLFKGQALNFQLIQDNLLELQDGVDEEGLRVRRASILSAIEESVETFNKIKDVGEEFQRSAAPQITK